MKKADLHKVLHLVDMVHAGLWTIDESLEKKGGRIINRTEVKTMLTILRVVIDELDVDGYFVKGHSK
jgi:hypothetical protein